MNTRLVVATLFFGGFVANMNSLALGPFMVPIAEDIGSSVAQVGQAATLALIVGAFAGLGLGPVSDHYGLRRLVIIGTLLIITSGIGTALAFNYWSLLMMRIPAGIAAGMILGLGISLINTRIAEGARRGAIAWVAGSGALAAVFGVPLLAVLGDIGGWRSGFWFVAALGTLLSFAYLRCVPADPGEPALLPSFGSVARTYRRILDNSVLVILLVATLFWATAWMGFVTYAGAFAMESINASLNGVSLIYFVGGLSFFFGNRTATHLLAVVRPTVAMLLCATVLSVSLAALFALATSWAPVLLLMAIAALAGGIVLPVTTILVAEATTGAHGTVMMLRQFMWGVGSGLGAATGGAAIGLGGYPMLGIVLASSALLSLIAAGLAASVESQPGRFPARSSGD